MTEDPSIDEEKIAELREEAVEAWKSARTLGGSQLAKMYMKLSNIDRYISESLSSGESGDLESMYTLRERVKDAIADRQMQELADMSRRYS